jgi:opacity protein-like surface antigen
VKKILMATALLALALATPASANIVLENKLSGTGDNVVLNSVVGDLALAQLNGQHQEFVRFRDLTGSTSFSAQSTGNDIKLAGSNNIFIQVFDAANQNVVGTTTEVFSLNGTGNAQLFVQAVDRFGVEEDLKFFNLGALTLTGANNFTLRAEDGEVMTSVRITSLGEGSITAFEHFRIDVAPVPQVAAVPELSTWAMMIVGFLGLGGLAMRKRNGESLSFRVV